MARFEDLPVGDQQAIANFTAFLGGASACVICLMPTTECRRAEGEPCCEHCRHRQLKTEPSQ